MILMNSILKVVDNSGAKIVKCLKVLKKTPQKTATLGDILIVSVQRINPIKKIKKGTIQRAIIVRTRKNIRRFDGSYIRFDKTVVVLVNKELKPIGTRIFGPVCKELRKKGLMKIMSLAHLAL